MISLELKRTIQQAAINAYPKELCGFIVQDEFIQVDNEHSEPEKSFLVSDSVWREFERTCNFFVHSHPDWYACPSESDMRQQMATAVPWGIVATNGQSASNLVFFGEQLPKADLKDRPFIHGVTDCYDAIRDWYKLNKDITLMNFPRSWEWWLHDDIDMYKDNFEKVGFKLFKYGNSNLKDLMPGDVFLASIGKNSKLNHGGVYTGNGLGYHHLTSIKPVDTTRLAKEDPVHRWSNHIRLWLRYDNG